MQFNENKFKEELLSNPKIENRYDNIKEEIEKRHIVMLESKPSLLDRLLDFTSTRAFKYSLATCGAVVLVTGVALGILLPQLGGEPDLPDVKKPPIFLGVSLKEVPSEEVNSLNYIHFAEELDSTSESDATLDKDTVIILDLAFENPDEFEIDSFTVSEKEGGSVTYTTVDYLDGSSSTHIYVNVGKMQDVTLNYEVGNITYLDEGVSKPVMIKGETNLTLSPSSDPTPPPIEEHEYTFTFENSEIYTDSASFSFKIEDNYDMLVNMRAVLYRNDTVVESQSINKENEVNISFDNLLYNSEYHLEIISDVVDNGEVKEEEKIFTHDFSTSKYFDEISITPSFISADISVVNKAQNVSVDSIRLLNEADELVKDVTTQESEFNISDLLANTTYKVEFTFSVSGEHVYKTTQTFTTLKYTVPTLTIKVANITGTTVDFRCTLNDPDDIATFSRIELYREGELYRNSQTETDMFTNLTALSNYELRVIYTYDLHEGEGSVELVATDTFETGSISLSVKEVTSNGTANANTNIPIRVTINNASDVTIKGFIIDGKQYDATKEGVGQTYFVSLDPIATTGIHEYSLTACVYEAGGVSDTYTFNPPKTFKIQIV